MTFLDWLLAGFGFVATLALIGGAWIMVMVRVRPRDLRDDDDDMWSPDRWP